MSSDVYIPKLRNINTLEQPLNVYLIVNLGRLLLLSCYIVNWFTFIQKNRLLENDGLFLL